jgi:hypothetical protein
VRCLGYPSDSSRAARECACETSCGRHPRRASQARQGRIGLRSWPVLLVQVTLHAPSQYSASVRGGPTSSMLFPSVGVGHSPLAIGLGSSAGLLVCVPDRLPVSPLSSPRAYSGAGQGWHGCGWIAVSAVLTEVPAPGRWTPHLRSPLGRHCGGGSPAARVRDFLLSLLAGVGHCSLAIGLGPSAGLLVGVLDRRPVSPLSSPRACSGAGSGWHCCGWIAVSAVLSRGPAPWRWSLLVLCPLGRHCGGGSPSARGCAGHADTGPGAACQLVRGQVDLKVGPRAAPGGHGQVTNQSATGSLTRCRWYCSRMRCRLSPKRLGRRGPGRRAALDSGAGTCRP